ncbi:MAG: 1-deoxy-D-xylulose-5-phosphate synthase [Flavobacteriales bacterium]|nr:1-deoxy-D-xylulose-5-phosphate synthase [Flavobacteriales bacterium]
MTLPSLEALRQMSPDQLSQVATDAVARMIALTHRKPGHMASSAGVAQLTVALHALMDSPRDLLIWDVGHQAYIHKLLTGREGVFSNNREPDGPSGFPKRDESPYDAFGTGHSSTALSALIGMARADALQSISRKRVAVVGDGAFTGGMIYEAMNNAGGHGDDVLLILNDNGKAIEDNVGALHNHKRYQAFADSLNWSYLGDVDGRNMVDLLAALELAMDSKGPRMLRVLTQRPSSKDLGIASQAPSTNAFQKAFARSLIQLAQEDKRIVGLTAAMATGCSLDDFRAVFPERFFDVGIAEPHAITAAAGMATQGLRPVVNMYSTFAQRAVDQWIHDVALQRLPVILCLDRAGIVGEDGSTHHGVFDLALFRAVPHTAIWAPRDEDSLREAMQQALAYGGPSIIRYPKGQVPDLPEPAQRGNQADVFQMGTGVVHWCMGTTIVDALREAAPSDSVVDLRMIKPIAPALLERFAKNHYQWIVWEDAQAINGLGSALASWLAERGIQGIQCLRKGYPDRFIGHGPRDTLIADNQR